MQSARGRVGMVWAACSLACLLSAGSSAGGVDLSAARARRSSPRVTFYFGLKRPESQAMAAFFSVQQPGSRTYRRFLTRREIAARYGASRATRAGFRRAVGQLGLSAKVDGSGVFARVTGTVNRWERLLHVHLTSTFDPSSEATSYYVSGPTPPLPRSLRPFVREAVLASSRSAPPPRPRLPTALLGATRAPTNAGTWTRGCRGARATGGYSFAQIRHAYGVDAVGGGAGGSLAIFNDAEGVSTRDANELARCFRLPNRPVRALLTDNQARPFRILSPEPMEDLALARGIGPQLSVLLAQGWGFQDLWFLAPAKVLTLPRLPDAMSISYGYCEFQVLTRRSGDAPGASLLNSLLVRLGLAGVGVFASAGDSGSTCNGVPRLGVAWPGSSPFLTSVGGTRLVVNRANSRVREVVWNDLQWLSADNGGGAGGGGLSAFYSRPPYQRAIRVSGRRRAVPDAAVHASMLPGYPIRFAGRWLKDAGTSAAAPLLAAAFATLSARERAAGRPPLGPVNGLLYWLRRHQPRAVFDIVSGSNRYNPHVRGYRARRGYDLASGVGVPQFATLARVLPRPAR